MVIDGWQFFFYDRKAAHGYVPVPKPDHDGDGGEPAEASMAGDVSALNIQGGRGGIGVHSGGRGGSPGPVVTVVSGRPAAGRGGRGRGGGRGGGRGRRLAVIVHSGAAGDALALVPAERGAPRQKLRKKKGATSAATALPVKAHVKDKE